MALYRISYKEILALYCILPTFPENLLDFPSKQIRGHFFYLPEVCHFWLLLLNSLLLSLEHTVLGPKWLYDGEKTKSLEAREQSLLGLKNCEGVTMIV